MGRLVGRILLGMGILSGISAIVISAGSPEKVWPISILAGFSLILLSLYAWRNIELLKSYSRKRAVHLRLNSMLTALFVLFILVVLNLIIRQFYFRVDMTSSKRYSLSSLSVTALEKVDTPIRLIYFGTVNTRDYERVKYLLEAYRYENRNILYEIHDLDSVPLLAKEYGVREYGTFVLEKKGKVYRERGSDEQTVTNLIIRAMRKRRLKVRFLQGHEEKTLSDTDRSGYGKVVELLRKSGFEALPLDLTETGGVPPDTDLLVIASPMRGLKEDEYRMLRFYRMGGGKFVILVDSPDQLAPFLSEIFIRISRYPVYDSQHVAGIGPSAPLVRKYIDNPITGDFQMSTFFPGVHEIHFFGPRDKFNFNGIVKTTEKSWFEKNGDGIMQKEEEEGYQRLAAVLIPKKELYRVAIFGDSDFISNAYISIGGNGELFLRTLNWLVGEGSLTSIASNPGDVIPLFVTERQVGTVRVVGPVGIPVLIFLSGMIVWFRRRRL
jgi:ABC-type uncharacterized transport system involved in gliding motility auxiliary subunit